MKRDQRAASATQLLVVAIVLMLIVLLTPAGAFGQTSRPGPEHAGQLAEVSAAAATWALSDLGYRVPGGPDELGRRGQAVIVLPAGRHELSEPLDLRSVDCGVTLIGHGATLVATWTDDRPIIDATGARNLRIEGVTLRGECGVGLLLARRPPRASDGKVESSNHIGIRDVTVDGKFRRAGVAVIAAEHVTLTECALYARGKAPALLAANALPWAAEWPQASTMQVFAARDCFFFAGEGAAVELHANRSMILSDITFDGGGGSCAGAIEAAVRIRTVAGAQPQMIAFRDMRWETNEARDWLEIAGPANVGGLCIDGGSIYCRERLIDARGVYLVGLTLRDPFVWSQSASDWGTPRFVMRPNYWGWETTRPLIEAGSYDEPLIDIRTVHLPASDAAAGVWHPTTWRAP